jgi:hypothetical protein
MAYTVEMKRYVDVTLSGTLDERLVGSRRGGGSYDHVVTRRPLRGRGGARERLMEGGIGSFGEAAEATAEAGAACEAAVEEPEWGSQVEEEESVDGARERGVYNVSHRHELCKQADGSVGRRRWTERI